MYIIYKTIIQIFKILHTKFELLKLVIIMIVLNNVKYLRSFLVVISLAPRRKMECLAKHMKRKSQTAEKSLRLSGKVKQIKAGKF